MRKAFAVLAMLLLMPSFAFAQINVADTGILVTGEEVYGPLSGDQTDLGTFLGARVINPLFAMLGVLFLIFMIYGGIKWMTAGGNSDAVGEARQLIVNAVIGLVIILASYAITRFVIIAVTSA